VPDTERLWEAPGHATGRWHNVFVQIRTGEATVETLGQIETSARLMRAQQIGPRGALFIKGPGAPPMVSRVAVLQREMISGLESDRLLHACGVVEGDGLSDIAQRVALRVILSTKRFVVRSTVGAGALWVVSSIGSPHEARALAEVVESLRPARSA
jgi:hypothetical protein